MDEPPLGGNPEFGGLTNNMQDVLTRIASVAIIDDDQSIREAIKTLLDSLGLNVEEFSSAEVFLTSGRSQPFDCLLLDVRMPGLGGLELQRRLIADNSRIPIVFITAHYSEEDRTKAMEAGAIDFLNKPFSEHALLTAIGSALASQTHVTDGCGAEPDSVDQ
jgi:FixJ family two-component response regulator